MGFSLARNALLACVSISKWGNRKTSKDANAAVEKEFQTEKKATNTSKKLLPDSKELAKVYAVESSIRDLFKANTLPWLTDGTRILASKNYIDFAREFQAKQNEFTQAVEDFLAVYQLQKTEAQKILGGLYNVNDYPTEKSIRAAFQCTVSYAPLSDVSDFRVELSEADKTAYLEAQKSVETEAVAYCFRQLEGVIRTAVERLENPTAHFKNSLINNITELCAVLPRLNVTENADLEAARREIETLVSKVSPETCRVNPGERQSVTQKLKEISEKIGAFMGAPPVTDSGSEN